MDLKKALDRRLVNTSIFSLGGHQGLCINMALKNITKDSLLVTVAAGTRLNSEEDRYQDILVTKEQVIGLARDEVKWFKVNGYCCQASNCSPQTNARYNVNGATDSNLVKLGRFLSANDFESITEQYAVWAISDRKPTANITSTCAEALRPLKQFVADLKGEVLPWYEIVSVTYVLSNGSIVVVPTKLTGQLNYSLSKTEYATLCVKDKSGKQVCFVRSQWLMPAADQNYELEIPLKELASGKYTIELSTETGQLVKKEFEI